ncbi:MAG TPA: Hpt domain-containing protein [bacterium]|nr:Hpt domain-containing protein [Candidatus Omnitrophota bacterium]HOJ61738.1 Hpt domain-containing protein [bacterium]HOL94158.1 Hpt domain-containing protein [bacterium]HPP01185.1 Hpt domain-containing protein [bacterium]HXK94013.1 Hpt domain-containing protein [bacterium]
MNSVINREEILQRVDNDWHLLSLIIKLFLDKHKILLQGIWDGIRENDGDRVLRAAHSLKGMVSNFSAMAVIHTAIQLENLGKSGDLTQAPALYAQLETELQDLKAALLELKNEHLQSTPMY